MAVSGPLSLDATIGSSVNADTITPARVTNSTPTIAKNTTLSRHAGRFGAIRFACAEVRSGRPASPRQWPGD